MSIYCVSPELRLDLVLRVGSMKDPVIGQMIYESFSQRELFQEYLWVVLRFLGRVVSTQ